VYLDFIFKVFDKFQDKDALTWNGTVYSYSSLINNIKRSELFCNKNNIKPGMSVAIIGDFSPNSIAVLFALIEKQCIIVPLTRSSQKRHDQLFKIAQVETVITIDEKDTISVELISDIKQNNYYDQLRTNKHPGLVLFTSGTSGQPKAAVHDFLSLLEKFKTKKRALRTINFLLFDHWGGLNTMFHILSNGGLVITTKNRSPEEVCKLIETYKIELLPASPTFLNLLLLSSAHNNHTMTSLKIISYGTEPMPQSTLKRLKTIFPDVKLLQTYGLIELGVMQSKSESDDSLWVKVGGEGYKTRIVNDILQIKADSAMLGYLNAPSPFTDDGWFITGDRVLQKDGYIKILGRDSEIINVGGEKVYPQEVENIVLEMEDVIDVVVFGEKNALMGEIVSARIVVKNNELDTKLLTRDIKKYCKSKLDSFKIPMKFDFTTDLQYGSRFKKRRADN
tara:strand:+ start:2931 stop:4280 length:1350 start_codon:yes stop_codon:yes gene_type:complete